MWARKELRFAAPTPRKTKNLRQLLKALDEVEETEDERRARTTRPASRSVAEDPRKYHADWLG